MQRLSKVDELHLSDHCYLKPTDKCLFLREYIPHVGYSGGETNSLISNFKKGVDREGQPGWRYKGLAIQQIARELASTLNPEWLKIATLIPIPPSKSRQSPLYDDRMSQVLRLFPALVGLQGDVRELIIQIADMVSAHTAESRPSPAEIRANYTIDSTQTTPSPKAIGIFDDVLTTGAHFRAAESLLSETFPGVSITGIFVARRIISEIDWEAGFEPVL
ncbi:MAG: hypothetical protein BVN29_06815 [Nitrospira sp. ST-bin5]|nr:MAG: hypothetical protein BVN29_06815 [Nitrospira sp. ST-bin5]